MALRESYGVDSDGVKEVPIEQFHRFTGQPQCAMISDVYVPDKHLHKEIEMVYVLRGQVQVMVEERIFDVQRGELLYIRAAALHQYMAKQPSTDIVKLKFMKEWLLPPFFNDDEKEAYQYLYCQVFKTKQNGFIQSLIHSMLDSALPQYNAYNYFGKLIELTAFLLDNLDCISERMSIPTDNMRYMESALQYMQDNCCGKLTLSMLAGHLGLTESYCSKYIRKNTGITFVEYLNALRVSNAQRLLIYTDCSVTEIVEQTGFASVQTFNRVFKAQTGRSPSEYRKQKGIRPHP